MSAKSKDDKNRWRNKTVGFRVSPEEWEQIEIAVSLSGLAKQDYIMKKLANRDIIVQGNPRVYKALCNQLARVLEELNRIDGLDMDKIDTELLDTINLITVTLDGLNNEEDNILRGKS